MLGKGRKHISLYVERTQPTTFSLSWASPFNDIAFFFHLQRKDPNSFHFNSMFYYKRTFALVIDNADEGAH